MDNNYYTEKIAPKNKPQEGQERAAQNARTAPNAPAAPAQPAGAPAQQSAAKRPAQDKRDRQRRPEHSDRTEQRHPRRERCDRAESSDRAERYDRSERYDRGDRPAQQLKRPAVPADPDAPVRTVEIIGIRFKDVGKVYYFSPAGIAFKQGDKAIVETARGVECGEIVLSNRQFPESGLVSTLKNVLRKATEADLRQLEQNRKREKEIMRVFAEKIEQHRLDMKPIEIEVTFDGSKILFYFTSDGRVDFRELVKDLAGVYRTRIELRQIGVRDEAKMLGGLGICGRPFCCSSFLGEFQPVSIKMAKEQSLSLNPTKISGTCGRLMCCLKYEQDCYEEFLRTTPKAGALVETPEGRGVVDEVNLLTGILKVKLDKKPDVPLSINKSEVKVLRDGQIRVNRDEIKALRNLEDN